MGTYSSQQQAIQQDSAAFLPLNGGRFQVSTDRSEEGLTDADKLHLITSLDMYGVCQRQVDEIIEALPAIGARIVFQGTGTESLQRVDGSTNSARFQRSIFDCKALELALIQPLGILKPILVEHHHSTRSRSNLYRCQHMQACEFIYLCLLSRSNACDEYLLLVTDFPLSVSQQKLVSQRAHLLRDYLSVHRVHLQSQESVLEQKMRRVEHQLRNPLAAIELLAETLCLQLPSGRLREQALSIQAAVSDMDDRLRQLLASDLPSGPKHRCDLRDIALDAISVLKPSCDEKHLAIDVPETPLFMSVNRSQIKQVFENLLSNAIHFSPAQSAITCSWRAFRREALVEISDRGPGLPPQDLSSVFMPYFSRRQGGTGLGLTIAKRFICAHHGDIWCHTLPEGGAKFSFTLK